MYNDVVDTKGNVHLNAKMFGKGTIQAQVWFWNQELNDWVFGGQGSQSAKQTYAFNQLIINSETQTSKDLILSKNKLKTIGIDQDTGETYPIEIYTIEHLMVKVNNGELQFEKSWEITHSL